jgi:hypothetical protein
MRDKQLAAGDAVSQPTSRYLFKTSFTETAFSKDSAINIAGQKPRPAD